MFQSLDGERGAATTQVVLLAPALVLLIMTVLQIALYEHASHVATAAAQQATSEAQLERGSADAGRHAAQVFLDRTGDGLLSALRVEVDRAHDRTRAVVSGAVVSIVPGLRLQVRAVSEGPSERFRPLTER